MSFEEFQDGRPCGSFCVVSQRKGEKTEEIVEEMKERNSEERGTEMKVKKLEMFQYDTDAPAQGPS